MNTTLRKVALGLTLGLCFLSAACGCPEGATKVEVNEDATDASEREVQLKCVNGEWVRYDPALEQLMQ